MDSPQGMEHTTSAAGGGAPSSKRQRVGGEAAGPSSSRHEGAEPSSSGHASAGASAAIAQQAGPDPGHDDVAGAGAGAGAGADPLDRLPDAPFHLMQVQGIPDWANEGFLGVKLADLVRGPMKWVLASTYMLDFQWLVSACPDLRQAEALVVVVHKENTNSVATIENDVRAAGLQDRTMIFPPRVPMLGSHHSKAFIIQYERGLRVIVHTANLVDPNRNKEGTSALSDCNKYSQGIWWQDLPLKDDQSPQSPQLFEEDLGAYLEALHMPAAAADKAQQLLADHDFSAARAHLVPSVPGYHRVRPENELRLWGHMRLKQLLSEESFPATFAGAPLVAQFSSVGSLDDKWLTEFRTSLSAGKRSGEVGVDGKPLQLGTPAAPGASGLRLVWPTVADIQNSLEGWLAGDSVPGIQKNVSKECLEEYWHKWDGEPTGRQHATPHIKSYARYAPGGQEVAWWLVGSHNLSKAAWGALPKEESQLMVRSYELSVLLLPRLEAAYRASRWRGFSCTSAAPMPAAAATGAGVEAVRFSVWSKGQPQQAALSGAALTVPLPIPYSLPPVRYSAGVDVPWAKNMAWPGVDSLGNTWNPNLVQGA